MAISEAHSTSNSSSSKRLPGSDVEADEGKLSPFMGRKCRKKLKKADADMQEMGPPDNDLHDAQVGIPGPYHNTVHLLLGIYFNS